MKTIISSFIFLSIIAINIAKAQDPEENDSTKKVTVVKEYQPIINDAFKINIEPEVKDTVTIKPLLFKYYFVEYPIFVKFEPEKIKAATMRGEPLPLLYQHYINIGIGSQITPYRFMPDLEYYYNSSRNQRFVYGAHLKLFHASGKVKLDNGNKISAPVTENIVELFGKRIMNHSDISTRAFFNRNTYTYYGIPYFVDTIPDKNNIYQRTIHGGLENRWFSTHKDTTQLAYDSYLNYQYSNDKYSKAFENRIDFGTSLSKYIKGQQLGIKIDGNYFNQNLQTDTINALHFNIAPFISVIGNIWRINLGVAMAYYKNLKDSLPGQYNFYSNVLLQYNIIENFMIPYLGIGGGLKTFDYQTILQENPYVKPNIAVKNQSTPIELFGGIKGNFTQNFFYDVNVKYAIINNMHFYVNDTTTPLYNMFDVVYDDVELLRFHGEITWKKSHKFNLFLRATYNKYNMMHLAKPWQKPELFVAFTPQYQIRDKIYINADLYYADKMYAYIKEGNAWKIRTITPTYDLNLGTEYRWSRNFSAYLRLYNILGKYEMWNYYPTFGFHIKLGITYLL